ncbi:MAG: glycoside hydrolase family 92 protein [Candidatus Hydrogenedentes bacterium]|nr:glycoside hydrolase family 92 protein [Candidatus Hydrogenedentota bacterium]
MWLIKRLLKWAAMAVLAVVLSIALLIFGVWAYHKSIVAQTPGALVTASFPGPLGAMVNPFSGTGGVWWLCAHNTPAATAPFGMVRLAPDTQSYLFKRRGTNRSGYYYGDNQTAGFSHTRLVGADAQEGGVFRVFPTVESRIEKTRPKGRTAKFSHTYEKAFPGYYAVRLSSEKVLAEMTATPRVGVHRYTFAEGERPRLILDATSTLGDKRCENGVVRILPASGEIEGSCRVYGSFSGRYGGLDVYFAARAAQPFSSHGISKNGAFSPGATESAGNDLAVELGFDSGKSPVELRVALSYVSIANARKNLDAEAPPAKSFQDILEETKKAWEDYLSRIRIEGGTETQRRIFYTALYRTAMMPTTFSDVNGEYEGFDRQVHRAEGFTYYTDFSLWDTFRTTHPLYNLAARREQGEFMRSLLEMAKAGGAFPRWPSGAGYTNCMFGTPADVAVSEAWLKGIRDFDGEKAYQILRRTVTTGPPEGSRFAGRHGLKEYLQYGYCPTDKMHDAVSATLEYAWEDHALSLFAAALGHDADAAEFAGRGQFYKNTWNPATQFFQPRDTAGNFPGEFRPLALSYTDVKQKYTKDYVEGSPMQWRWCVPHDHDGLIALFKSRGYFLEELENFMAKSRKSLAPWHPGSHYWQGNEHHLNAAYLFNGAGRPDLTQKWVRWILETKHADNHIGLDGNDDGGTLSAWYILSSLGFYPIAGTTRYELGAPLFDRAVVDMNGPLLTVVAENNGPKNMYVQKVFLNDTPLDRTWFTHDEVAGGGMLRFVMGPQPKENETP